MFSTWLFITTKRLKEAVKRFKDVPGALPIFILAIVSIIVLPFCFELNEDKQFSIVVNIATTLLTTTLVFFLVESSKTNRKMYEFIKFFGSSPFSESGMPVIVLKAKPVVKGKDKVLEIEECPEDAVGAYPKYISQVIPIEEIHAAVAIQRAFSRYNAKVVITPDCFNSVSSHAVFQKGLLNEICFKNKELPGEGCISIGLGFNNATTLIKERSNNLFKIIYRDFEGLEFCSDDYCLIENGQAEYETSEKVSKYEHALIARIRRPIILSDRKCTYVTDIVCAGLTAKATQFAGTYLAEHWDNLLSLYDLKDTEKYNMAVSIEFNKVGAYRGMAGPVFSEAIQRG